MKYLSFTTLAVLVATLTIANTTDAAEQTYRNRASTAMPVSAENLSQDVKAEQEFGKEVAARILGRYRLYENKEQTEYVNLIGQAVAANADRPELTFHFAILDSETINAYAAPGGYIFVTRGALKQMQDEAELAAVLAHEVAHVSRKHVVKELKIQGSESSPEAGLARLVGGAGDAARVAFSQAVDKAVDILFESGLKQEDELEADRVGTLVLANTGYDATALRSYIVRVKKQQGTSIKVLEATHPPFDKRLALMDELIASEHLVGNPSAPRVKQRFQSRIK